MRCNDKHLTRRPLDKLMISSISKDIFFILIDLTTYEIKYLGFNHHNMQGTGCRAAPGLRDSGRRACFRQKGLSRCARRYRRL